MTEMGEAEDENPLSRALYIYNVYGNAPQPLNLPLKADSDDLPSSKGEDI